MKKIRYYFVAIALLATLSGPALQAMGSRANTASSRYASSASAPFVVGKLTRPVAFKPYWPCPAPGNDC
jgi:hypothetical protein